MKSQARASQLTAAQAATAGSQANIRVVLRMHPEASGTAAPALTIVGDNAVAVAQQQQQQQQRFEFDDVLDGSTSQQELYERVGKPLLKHALEGKHASLIAYGQSGAGKSHSVLGTRTAPGVVPQLCDYLFRQLGEPRRGSNSTSNTASSTWTVAVSIMEIYNENVRDLLGGNNNSSSAALPSLQLVTDAKTGAVRPRDLTVVPVTSCGEVMQLIDAAMQRRATAATRLNEQSSRSHVIVQLELRETRRVVLTKDNQQQVTTSEGLSSKLMLVDLAGSERINKSGAQGQQLKEAANINRSLTTLGRCVDCLIDKQLVPYRDSKLTMLLRDSLGGTAMTTLLAAVRPAHAHETLSTLTFTSRARTIVNTVVVHEDPAARKIRELEEKIHAMEQLQQNRSKMNRVGSNEDDDKEQESTQLLDLHRRLEREKEAVLEMQQRVATHEARHSELLSENAALRAKVEGMCGREMELVAQLGAAFTDMQQILDANAALRAQEALRAREQTAAGPADDAKHQASASRSTVPAPAVRVAVDAGNMRGEPPAEARQQAAQKQQNWQQQQQQAQKAGTTTQHVSDADRALVALKNFSRLVTARLGLSFGACDAQALQIEEHRFAEEAAVVADKQRKAAEAARECAKADCESAVHHLTAFRHDLLKHDAASGRAGWHPGFTGKVPEMLRDVDAALAHARAEEARSVQAPARLLAAAEQQDAEAAAAHDAELAASEIRRLTDALAANEKRFAALEERFKDIAWQLQSKQEECVSLRTRLAASKIQCDAMHEDLLILQNKKEECVSLRTRLAASQHQLQLRENVGVGAGRREREE